MSEINRLIAEARGYYVKQINDVPEYDMWCLYAPDGSRDWRGEFIPSSRTEFMAWNDQCPDYEHDLNEAWKLTADFAPNWFVTTVNWGHMGNVALMCQLICVEWLEWKNIPLPTTPAEPSEAAPRTEA